MIAPKPFRRLFLMLALLGAGLMSPMAAPAQTVAPQPSVEAAPGVDTGLQSVSPGDQGRPAPFGSELFLGTAPTYSPQTLDPNYLMKPGDKIAVSFFGLVNNQGEMTIDPQGNVIVPGVGPVMLGGVPANKVQSVIAAASRQIYRAGVDVYATPVSSSPIGVFVTGPVRRPGIYPGGGLDSIVTYLQRAGGIDPVRGSYRYIQVLRQGQVIATADLYDFLRNGQLPSINFRGGDVILVGDQGPMVAVNGLARAPFSFELKGRQGLGSEVITYARPRPEASHASISGVRNSQPYAAYLDLATFARTPIQDGDQISIRTDLRPDTVVVNVEGATTGPSVYVVPKGTSLAAFLASLPLSPSADRASIYLKRVSVAASQKQLLNESLDRFEQTYYTSPASTPAVAAARAADAQAITQFLQKARLVQPSGVMVLADAGDLSRIQVEADDVVVIPPISQVVTIGGEVNAPQTMVAKPGTGVKDYVARAGGFTDRADHGHILVLRPDGGIRKSGVQPGDRILVIAKLRTPILSLAKDLTQILYQVAIAARVASL